MVLHNFKKASVYTLIQIKDTCTIIDTIIDTIINTHTQIKNTCTIIDTMINAHFNLAMLWNVNGNSLFPLFLFLCFASIANRH